MAGGGKEKDEGEGRRRQRGQKSYCICGAPSQTTPVSLLLKPTERKRERERERQTDGKRERVSHTPPRIPQPLNPALLLASELLCDTGCHRNILMEFSETTTASETERKPSLERENEGKGETEKRE